MTNYRSFLHSTKRQRMPADHILNLLLILKLARRWVEAGRCSPTAPQPQHKHRQRNSGSHCTTDSKCLGKEVLKITRRNKISGREAPGSVFSQPLSRIEIIKREAEDKLRGEGGCWGSAPPGPGAARCSPCRESSHRTLARDLRPVSAAATSTTSPVPKYQEEFEVTTSSRAEDPELLFSHSYIK